MFVKGLDSAHRAIGKASLAPDTLVFICFHQNLLALYPPKFCAAHPLWPHGCVPESHVHKDPGLSNLWPTGFYGVHLWFFWPHRGNKGCPCDISKHIFGCPRSNCESAFCRQSPDAGHHETGCYTRKSRRALFCPKHPVLSG